MTTHLYDEKTIARFWAKVDKNGPIPAHCPELGPCWVWTGSMRTNGYGKLEVFDGNRRTVAAHRLAYEIQFGEIPDGLIIMHECDNKKCQRHLTAGTNSRNTQDAYKRGLIKPRPRGVRREAEQSGAQLPKLSDEEALALRKFCANGGTFIEAAQNFGISERTASAIARGVRYKGIAGPVVSKRLVIGESSHSSILTESDVILIRQAVANGTSRKLLAQEYGITVESIGQIIRRETWKRIP